ADDPFLHQEGALRAIERDRRLVPVKHGPFEPRQTFADAAPGKAAEKRLARPLPAEFRLHEKVFEIDAVSPAEGRERVKPEGKAGDAAVDLGDIAKDPRLRPEERRCDIGRGRLRLRFEAIIDGEIANEAGDGRGIVRAGGADGDAHTATGALIAGCGSYPSSVKSP